MTMFTFYFTYLFLFTRLDGLTYVYLGLASPLPRVTQISTQLKWYDCDTESQSQKKG